jgi:hypothetical protein
MKSLLSVLMLTAVALQAAPTLPYTPDELAAYAFVAVEKAVQAHKEPGFRVTGYQAGVMKHRGKTFTGTVVFYKYQTQVDGQTVTKSGEAVTETLDKNELPSQLLGWLVKEVTPERAFTLGELTTAGKEICDASRRENGNAADHEVSAFKVYESQDVNYAVKAAVSWRHQGEGRTENFGCHKHEGKMECHKL